LAAGSHTDVIPKMEIGLLHIDEFAQFRKEGLDVAAAKARHVAVVQVKDELHAVVRRVAGAYHILALNPKFMW
jgi:hypothetical protein